MALERMLKRHHLRRRRQSHGRIEDFEGKSRLRADEFTPLVRFFCPPLYRSPVFPVFFHSGSRRYWSELSGCSPEEPLPDVDLPSDRYDDALISRLIRYLSVAGDELIARQTAAAPLPIYFPFFPIFPKLNFNVGRHVVPRVWPSNIFTRNQGSDPNESEDPLVLSEQNFAECSPLDQSDLPQLPGRLRRRHSSCLTRPVSDLSPSQGASAETWTRARSLPDLLSRSSFEEFTPEVTADENDETFQFVCSRPGRYQCSVTGLVFHMEGGGEVLYRVVPWNRRLLARLHKQPAGPLFDIKCAQRSVRQLQLPHCEIRSSAGGHFLSVAHVKDEGIEIIVPQEVTETHVVIKITGFSGFGNVKDEDSAPDPVRALVLMFYRPLADPDPMSVLNVLLLPRNVVLRDVLRTRKKVVGDETYIETSPHCKLKPQQEYTLSTCPEDDSVLVEPKEAEFDCDSYDNYFPSFQVSLETTMKHIRLFLRDTDKQTVWQRRVCLSSSGVRRPWRPGAPDLPPHQRLLEVRSSFIEAISGPVLKSLLDRLFEKKVLTDSERESADAMQNQRDKARFVIDTVRKKGDAASSEMTEFLCETDPFLSEHLDLI